MNQVLVADLIDVALGPERQLSGSAFGPLVDQRPNVAVKGAAVEIPLDEVLLDLGPQGLQQETQMPEDRIVPQHRVLTLDQVVDADGRHHRDERCGDPPDPGQEDCRNHQRRGKDRHHCDKDKTDQRSPPPATECSPRA